MRRIKKKLKTFIAVIAIATTLFSSVAFASEIEKAAPILENPVLETTTIETAIGTIQNAVFGNGDITVESDGNDGLTVTINSVKYSYPVSSSDNNAGGLAIIGADSTVMSKSDFHSIRIAEGAKVAYVFGGAYCPTLAMPMYM